MLPVATLPTETARDLAGVCFDIDDTVTTEGVLDPKAYAALHALREAGLRLLAVTGRPLGWAEIAARTWPVDGAVGENGAGWLSVREGELQRGYFEDEATRAEHTARLEQLAREVERKVPEVALTDDAWARRCDMAWDVGEYCTQPPEVIERLSAVIAEAGAHVVVSTVHAHATYSACDKPSGATKALDALLGVDLERDRDRWLFVGDSGNDAAAFEWFSLSAGVANVRDWLDRLPAPPKYVASQRCGAGFAEIAEVILRGRRAH